MKANKSIIKEQNDGLSADDFKDWFKDRQFVGVIINLTNFRY
jgi:hypothetical protein